MKIGLKITLTFFLIVFLSMAIISGISYLRAKESLEKQTYEELTAVREMKAAQIEDYFKIITDQVTTSAQNPLFIEAMKEFKAGYNAISSDKQQIQTAKANVRSYFEKEFLPKARQNFIETNLLHDLDTNSSNGFILQDLYYASNPYKEGEKHKLNSAGDNSDYSKAHLKYHPTIRNFMEKFDYHDIFLIDHETGNIVYTVYKETDFATSLTKGPFWHTNLASAFHAANNTGYDTATHTYNKDFTKIVDFKPYLPSYDAEASFIAAPIMDGTKKIGILVFQMPIDRINDIMTNKQQWQSMGLGHSGETYIVGNDFSLRNQSRFLIEDSANYFKLLSDIKVDPQTIRKIKNYNSSIGLQPSKTEGSEAAINGKTGAKQILDYRGIPVLSAFKPLNIADMHWAIMSEMDEAEAFGNITTLKNNILVAFAILLVIVLAVSYFVSREITKPLKELTVDALELAKGNMNVEIKTGKKDEIGVLSVSFKRMQFSINKLIDDLKFINHNLEDTVAERTAEITQQNEIIQEKQKEIVDSIHYAHRIQTTILAKDEYLDRHLDDYFVLFKPKAIVSGDFYWATSRKNMEEDHAKEHKFFLMVCDSTGHGVPGAFMSLLNISFLNEAISDKRISEPNEILNHVRKRLIRNISRDGGQDGMDGIVVCFDRLKNTITYSAAHNAPVIVRNKTLIEFSANKMPVGIGVRTESFTTYEIAFEKGDMLYMYTDGYADQFGGPNGKKFKYKTLNNLLVEISDKPVKEQKEILSMIFESWKGELEQIDDVCVFGVRL
jgi:serine phosphatase RsbU (regulator of sigma subunit)